MDIGELIESYLQEEAQGSPVGDFLQSKIHESFTVTADRLAQLGVLNVEERIALSSCIGDALQAFRESIEGKAASAARLVIPYDILMRITFDKRSST